MKTITPATIRFLEQGLLDRLSDKGLSVGRGDVILIQDFSVAGANWNFRARVSVNPADEKVLVTLSIPVDTDDDLFAGGMFAPFVKLCLSRAWDQVTIS